MLACLLAYLPACLFRHVSRSDSSGERIQVEFCIADTSAELNASNESGGTCIEVTPNDSADSLSMTFKPEELRAIMFGSRLQGQSEQPSLEEEETSDEAAAIATATCEQPTTSTHETEQPSEDPPTDPESRSVAPPPPIGERRMLLPFFSRFSIGAPRCRNEREPA